MRRAFAAVALIALAVGAHAEGPRWHAVAPPLHDRLPAIEITLGYPGLYAPIQNSPIELRATATKPFDGYIGFTFVVGQASTGDTPILSRAVITPGTTWTFDTTVRLRYPAETNRELVVQWYDRNLRLMASRKTGVPPWSAARKVLFIGSKTPERLLGREAIAIEPASLANDAQWFTGFQSVVVPVDVWLDLPHPVREAVFHSLRPTVFFGVPRDDQRFAAIDDATIPVRFAPGAGSYEVPHLFANDAPSVRPSRFSWRAANGADVIGATERPYMAITARSAYVADDVALRQAIPSTRALAVPKMANELARDNLPRYALHHLTNSPPLLSFIALIVIVPLLWQRLKKSADVRYAVAGIVIAALVLTARGAMRRTNDLIVKERWITASSSASTIHHWDEQRYGAAPLPATNVTDAEARTLVSAPGISDVQIPGEIRSRGTLVGHGIMLSKKPWDLNRRRRERQEQTPALSVSVIEGSPRHLTLDYDVPFTPQYLLAFWTAAGVEHMGEAKLASKKGRVTIAAGSMTRDPWAYSLGGYWDIAHHVRAESVWLAFADEAGTHGRYLEWEGPGSPRTDFFPYTLSAFTPPEPNGVFTMTYRLPSEAFPATGHVSVWAAFGAQPVGDVRLTGERGSIVLQKTTRYEEARTLYQAPIEELARIARPGEAIEVRFQSGERQSWSGEINTKVRIAGGAS